MTYYGWEWLRPPTVGKTTSGFAFPSPSQLNENSTLQVKEEKTHGTRNVVTLTGVGTGRVRRLEWLDVVKERTKRSNVCRMTSWRSRGISLLRWRYYLEANKKRPLGTECVSSRSFDCLYILSRRPRKVVLFVPWTYCATLLSTPTDPDLGSKGSTELLLEYPTPFSGRDL